MKRNKLSWYLLSGLGGYLIIRHLGKSSGATYEEVLASLPGDGVIPRPMEETTHAISINAPPSVVWKWLIQAGYRGAGRAGWYSNSWIDKLVEGILLRLTVPPDLLPERPGMRSAEEILPEFQYTAVGDIIPDGPPNSAYFMVKEVDPERAWVLYSDSHVKYISPRFLHGTSLETYGEFTWVFVLDPIDERGTRLILRTRLRCGPRTICSLFLPLFYLSEAIFPGLILRGIKERAEGMVSSGEEIPREEPVKKENQ